MNQQWQFCTTQIEGDFIVKPCLVFLSGEMTALEYGTQKEIM